MLIALALGWMVAAPSEPQRVALRVESRCRITSDGRRVPLARLHDELMRLRRYKVEPELHFLPGDNTSFDCVNRVLTVVMHSGITKLGFIGNEVPADAPESAASEQH